MDQIDRALLRKGRLTAEYHFGKLDSNTSSQLLTSLGNDYRTEVPMALTDIFNVEDMMPRSESLDMVKGGRIGFTGCVAS